MKSWRTFPGSFGSSLALGDSQAVLTDSRSLAEVRNEKPPSGVPEGEEHKRGCVYTGANRMEIVTVAMLEVRPSLSFTV
jgi:hypothetical protein